MSRRATAIANLSIGAFIGASVLGVFTAFKSPDYVTRIKPPTTLKVLQFNTGARGSQRAIAYKPSDQLDDLRRKISEAYPTATLKEMTYYYGTNPDDISVETAVLDARQYPYFQQRVDNGQVRFVVTD
jgi:hypothetical protein